ncbi:MAG: hypothetical protein ACD_73C00085G0003 [uncultured bacterium]|nr:MAG: hypothetical protein ACD_73C00085G0003 [uncultured bacterium]
MNMHWKKMLPDFISKQLDQLFKRVENAMVFFNPTYVSKSNSFFSPIIAIIALITAIFMVGIAIGSFFMLFSSLLILYFILTKVFGIQLDTGDVFAI